MDRYVIFVVEKRESQKHTVYPQIVNAFTSNEVCRHYQQ